MNLERLSDVGKDNLGFVICLLSPTSSKSSKKESLESRIDFTTGILNQNILMDKRDVVPQLGECDSLSLHDIASPRYKKSRALPLHQTSSST